MDTWEVATWEVADGAQSGVWSTVNGKRDLQHILP